MHAGELLAVEQLDELKRTTRQLNITLNESTTPLPPIDGKMIYERRRGRRSEVLIRGLDDTAVERLRFAENIVAIESRTPSLEEIFVAYVTGAPQPAPNASQTESVELIR